MLSAKTTLPEKLKAMHAAGATIRLAMRYVVVTALMVALAFAGQVLSRRAAEQRRSDLHVLGLATQQRVTSQQLVRAALSLTSSDEETARRQAATELAQLSRAWDEAHNALRHGNAKLQVAACSDDVETMFAELHPKYVGMDQAAFELVNLARMSPALMNESGYSFDAPLERLVRHERGALAGMDRIIAQLEREAADRATSSASWQQLVMLLMLAAVLLQGLLVFVPAARRLALSDRRLAQAQAELAAARLAADQQRRSTQSRPVREAGSPLRRIEPLSAVA
jgi:hypothetical protein